MDNLSDVEGRMKNKQTSLPLAIALSIISFAIVFITFGVQKGYPLSHHIAQALGGSFAFPTIHVAIASIFKSKRNPSTRRKIYIGWAIAIIILQALTLLLRK